MDNSIQTQHTPPPKSEKGSTWAARVKGAFKGRFHSGKIDIQGPAWLVAGVAIVAILALAIVVVWIYS